MREDTFSRYHPLVNLVYFAGAVCFTMLIQAPAFLIGNIVASGIYYAILRRSRCLSGMVWTFAVFLVSALMNPIVNTRGKQVLFRYFGRPYTLESLQYGIVVGLVLAGTLLWLGCYNQIVTGNKLIALFGNLAPALSLMLIMIFRMIPDFIKKAEQIIHARGCIGKWQKNLDSGMQVMGILTSWALENSVITADSMRSRGYGTGSVSHYGIYQLRLSDGILLGVMVACILLSVLFRTTSLGIIIALVYVFLPTGLRMKEEIQWYILKYRI